MAIISPGPVVTDIRGRVADVVFSRNRGGLFSRAAATAPHAPSVAELARRAAMTAAAAAWGVTLSEADRLAWHAYAATRQRPGRLGFLHPCKGVSEFISAYLLWDTIGTDPVPLAPPAGPPLPTPPCDISAAVVAGDLELDLSLTVPADLSANTIAAIYIGPELSPGRTVFSGTTVFQTTSALIGSGPGRTAAAVISPTPATTGMKLPIDVRLYLANTRQTSARFRTVVTVQ